MKTVWGDSQQYQLVRKTRRDDIDGTHYLVAGKEDLWIKLLKDRSPERERSVRKMIETGKGRQLEKPLEVVRDEKGFAGYTFKGPKMQVVPEKSPSDAFPNRLKVLLRKLRLNLPKSKRLTSLQYSYHRKCDLKITQKIAITLWGLFLLLMNSGLITILLTSLVSVCFNDYVADAFYALSMNGLISGIVGCVAMNIQVRVNTSRFERTGSILLKASIGFLIGVIIGSLLVLLFASLVTALQGVFFIDIAYIKGAVTMIILVVLFVLMLLTF